MPERGKGFRKAEGVPPSDSTSAVQGRPAYKINHIDITKKEKNEDAYNYFQRCAAEQEDYIEIFKYLKEKYCNKE